MEFYQSMVASFDEEWVAVVGCGATVACHSSSVVCSSGALVPECTAEHEVPRGHPLGVDDALVAAWLVVVLQSWGAEYCRGMAHHLVD